MEWFDFAVYGFFATAIGANFFPSDNPTTSLLSTLAVYGVAFLMRPLGGLVIGAIGDRRGRRYALTLSVVMMGLATGLMALLPNYDRIGAAAPVLLIILRCVQGFSAGGEWTGSSAFLIENAPANRRGLAASVVPTTAALSVAAGAAIALLINTTIGSSVATWGWRLPFLAAFPMTLVGLYVRLRLEDTTVFEELRSEGAVVKTPIRSVGRHDLRSVAIAFALAAITVLGFYYIAVYVTTFLITTGGMKPTTALPTVAIGSVIYAGLCVFAGALSDRIGRRPVSLMGGAGLAVVAVPAFLVMSTGRPIAAVAGIVLFGVFEAMHNTTTTTMLTELFPVGTRLTGSAIGYNLGAAVVAGPGPLIAAALAPHGTGMPAAYMAGVALVCTVLLAFFLPETSRLDIRTKRVETPPVTTGNPGVEPVVV